MKRRESKQFVAITLAAVVLVASLTSIAGTDKPVQVPVEQQSIGGPNPQPAPAPAEPAEHTDYGAVVNEVIDTVTDEKGHEKFESGAAGYELGARIAAETGLVQLPGELAERDAEKAEQARAAEELRLANEARDKQEAEKVAAIAAEAVRGAAIKAAAEKSNRDSRGGGSDSRPMGAGDRPHDGGGRRDGVDIDRMGDG